MEFELYHALDRIHEKISDFHLFSFSHSNLSYTFIIYHVEARGTVIDGVTIHKLGHA